MTKYVVLSKTLFHVCVYQEGAEHVEGNEVNYCESTATRHLFAGVVVGLRVTQLPWHAG